LEELLLIFINLRLVDFIPKSPNPPSSSMEVQNEKRKKIRPMGKGRKNKKCVETHASRFSGKSCMCKKNFFVQCNSILGENVHTFCSYRSRGWVRGWNF
jgi:hypothetical protein